MPLAFNPVLDISRSRLVWKHCDICIRYLLALKIGDAIVPLDADIRQWLPGDSVYENTVPNPWELKSGKYRLRAALLDPRTRTPAMRLAISGRQSDGWYDLGDITVD